MALDATVGGASANSYLSIADATARADMLVHSENWDAADMTTRGTALQLATKLLDLLIVWSGIPTTEEQALAWPRMDVKDPLRPSMDIPANAIPGPVLDATLAYARELLAMDVIGSSDVKGGAVKSLKIDGLTLGYTEGVSSAKSLPDSVTVWLPTEWWRLRDNLLPQLG